MNIYSISNVETSQFGSKIMMFLLRMLFLTNSRLYCCIRVKEGQMRSKLSTYQQFSRENASSSVRIDVVGEKKMRNSCL